MDKIKLFIENIAANKLDEARTLLKESVKEISEKRKAKILIKENNDVYLTRPCTLDEFKVIINDFSLTLPRNISSQKYTTMEWLTIFKNVIEEDVVLQHQQDRKPERDENREPAPYDK